MMNKFILAGSLFLLLSCGEDDADSKMERKRADSPARELQEVQDLEKPQESHSSDHVFIIQELRKQTGKIPIEPVLGGKMEFRKIKVLSERWVFATYDDGHIEGKSIYEYDILPGRKVLFTELLSDFSNN